MKPSTPIGVQSTASSGATIAIASGRGVGEASSQEYPIADLLRGWPAAALRAVVARHAGEDIPTNWEVHSGPLRGRALIRRRRLYFAEEAETRP
jgi:hypothetical protein